MKKLLIRLWQGWQDFLEEVRNIPPFPIDDEESEARWRADKAVFDEQEAARKAEKRLRKASRK